MKGKSPQEDGSHVALVAPPFPSKFGGVPMGLLYLATVLKEESHTCSLHDFGGTGITIQEAAREVLAKRPDVIAVTSTSPSLKEAHELILAIRALSKTPEFARKDKDKVCIVKGGWHEKFGGWYDSATLMEDDSHAICYVVTNPLDGTQELLEIANKVVARQPAELSRYLIDPQIGRCGGPEPPPYDPVLPDRDILKAAKREYDYGGIFPGLKATQLMTVRGCPFGCTFCAIQKAVDGLSLELIDRDLKKIRELDYGAVFVDDGTFTYHRERALEICKLLKKHEIESWACQTRVDRVDPDLLRAMRESGCSYVYYGLESGSPAVLRTIHKELDPETVIKAVQSTTALGMQAVTSFIFGVPLVKENGPWPALYTDSDTPFEWNQSIELIRKANPTAVVPSIFAYYPGSPAWNNLPVTSAERQNGYVDGIGRDHEIWTWFDDGYGAIHHVKKEQACEIKQFLTSQIGEYLV